jgi:hypothetical protein
VRARALLAMMALLTFHPRPSVADEPPPPQHGRLPAVPGRSGTVVIHTRNRFSIGSVRDMLVYLEDSAGTRDSMVTDMTGTAVFHHVRPGPAVIWSASRWTARDSVAVVAYRTTLDTLITSRRQMPQTNER